LINIYNKTLLVSFRKYVKYSHIVLEIGVAETKSMYQRRVVKLPISSRNAPPRSNVSINR